jgi:mitotic spindle assembly checkpoint protein MAD2
MVKKYGQTVLVTQDLALENYLNRYVHSRSGKIPFLAKSHLRSSILMQVKGKFYFFLLSSRDDNLSTLSSEWLLTGSVTQLVLAIIARDTRVTLERWVFDITVNEPPVTDSIAP